MTPTSDRTVYGAIQGCFSSAGQLCVSFERLYVQSGIFDAFVEAFVRRTKALAPEPRARLLRRCRHR